MLSRCEFHCSCRLQKERPISFAISIICSAVSYPPIPFPTSCPAFSSNATDNNSIFDPEAFIGCSFKRLRPSVSGLVINSFQESILLTFSSQNLVKQVLPVFFGVERAKRFRFIDFNPVSWFRWKTFNHVFVIK